ncbi:MAG TPA: Na(+)-translocating NADH-quinone reductase subunit A [Woeseiaceae bacterium]|nr:Na(+)-translocating NADH-quinone reductase subunit A [Woeseiaceae bacterium]
MLIRIRKGLDIPLAGAPQQLVSTGAEVSSVALLGADTPGLKPAMAVQAGDRVKLGQPLYTDKRNPAVPFTSPGSGIVSAINRGERRVLQSVVIDLDGDDAVSFPAFDAREIDSLDPTRIREILVASGLWTALRCRPFGRVPAPDSAPASLFVTAIDTNPLAPDPAVIISRAAEAFETGLRLVAKLTSNKTYVCTAPNSGIPCPDGDSFVHVEFAGPHPAGLAGTHIHFLHPVGPSTTVWHIGCQDVIAIGQLFLSGRLPVERVISLAGPMVVTPQLVSTRNGANIRELLRGETRPGALRVISGSVLSGHRAAQQTAWLGRYHQQVSVLGEGSPREFLAWMRPGARRYSSLRAYAGHLLHRRPFALTTSQNGSPRAMVATGSFERVMPLDILPTPLLKALLVRDSDTAQALGCLELDEEDLALCSFVCNGKYEYGPHLRAMLDEIEAGA